jgi:hypothetical protein
MKELGMERIDEGVCLNQLIPLYIKYRIGFHVLDFRYNTTCSHKEYDYKVNDNYSVLFYLIDGNHLYPIVDKTQQHMISQRIDKTTRTFKPKRKEPEIRLVTVLQENKGLNEQLYNNVDDILSQNDIVVSKTRGAYMICFIIY